MDAIPKLTQAHKNVLAVLRNHERELSIAGLTQRVPMSESKVRITLEELAEMGLIQVSRSGGRRIYRAKILPEGSIAWSAAINVRERPTNVQSDLTELKRAVEELQRAFEELDSEKPRLTGMSAERLDAITNLIPKIAYAVNWLHQFIH